MRQKESRKSWLYFIPAMLWWLLSLYLFLLPGSQFQGLGWMNRFYVDKIVHFVLFAVLVYLLYRPALKGKVEKYKKVFVIIIPLLAIAYGVAIELIQKHYVPFRSFDINDVLFDALGAVFPTLLLYSRVKSITR